MIVSRLSTFLLAFLVLCAAAQRPELHTKQLDPGVPSRVYDLSISKQVNGLPNLEVAIDPIQCASDGSAFLESLDLSNGYRRLYMVLSSGEATEIRRDLTQIDSPSFRSFYPGQEKLITLLASENKTSDSAGSKNSKNYLLYVSDRSSGLDILSTSHELFSVSGLKIEPVSAAILPSGNILLLGVQDDDKQPALLLLDWRGTILRALDISAQSYNDSQELREIYGEKRTDLRRILTAAKFVPYKNHILLLQPSSTLPILELDDTGVVRSITVKLPKGYLPESMVTSDNNLIIRARSEIAAKKMISTGVVFGEERPLYEVSADDGSLIREIKLRDLISSELVCAVDGSFEALHSDPAEPGQIETWHLLEGSRR